MKPISNLAVAVAATLALSAAAGVFPALAQSAPYGGQPPQNGGQGGYPGGPGGGAQRGYGPPGQGYGRGQDMRNMTLQQFQARQVGNLMRMDTDHDGRVTLAEWVAWHQTHPGRNGRQGDPARAFERIDVNHAGYITPDEMAAFAARRYARMEGGGPGDGQGPHQMGPGGNPPPQALNPQ